MLKFRKYVRDHSKHMHQSYLREALQRQQNQGQTSENNQPVQKDHTSGTMRSLDKAVREEDERHLRDGVVDSVKDSEAGSGGPCVAIVSGLFSQEDDIRAMSKLGMDVRTTAGVGGHLRGPFGKLGKCKVEFPRVGSVRPGDSVFVPT